MGTEKAKDSMKDFDWKDMMGNEAKSTGVTSNVPASGQPVIKKQFRKKFREIPEHYFIPRMSKPKAILFYGSFIVAGIGTGELIKAWIKKKIKEDGDVVVWEFGK